MALTVVCVPYWTGAEGCWEEGGKKALWVFGLQGRLTMQ